MIRLRHRWGLVNDGDTAVLTPDSVVQREVTRRWVPLVTGAIAGGLTAAVTFGEEFLTPLGNAIAAGLAAAITALLTYTLFPSAARFPAVVGIVAALAGLGFTVVVLKDDAPSGIASFVGGCEPFTVHAQNRYEPSGAAIRAAPLRSAKKVGSFDPNELVTLDGWVRTQSAYPTNTPPWDSDVWFHLADDSGWVSFAGVRSDPTTLDMTGLAPDGGRPAPTAPECSGSVGLAEFSSRSYVLSQAAEANSTGMRSSSSEILQPTLGPSFQLTPALEGARPCGRGAVLLDRPNMEHPP